MDFSPTQFSSIEADTPRTASLRAKWGDAVGEGSGFVAVPLPLLRLQAKMGLTATDVLVLINMLAHWWNPSAAVFPRTTTIARRMGINDRTVQRSMSKLLRLGLAERASDGKGRRTYQFAGLVKRLNRDLPAAMRLAGVERLDV